MGPSLRTPLAVRLVRAAVAITLTVAGVVAVVPPLASATSTAFFPQTSFAIDGNSAGPLDFLAPYGPGTTPGGYPTTGLYYDHRTVDMGGTSGCAVPGDDVAGSGVKVMDGPIWASGGPAPNAKTDLDYIDVAAEKVNVVNQIHDILYIGYEKCGGTGTWQAMLYLDDGDGIPPSAGDNGDYLFLFSFAPSSGTVTLEMFRRIGGAWTAQTFPADSIEGGSEPGLR